MCYCCDYLVQTFFKCFWQMVLYNCCAFFGRGFSFKTKDFRKCSVSASSFHIFTPLVEKLFYISCILGVDYNLFFIRYIVLSGVFIFWIVEHIWNVTSIESLLRPWVKMFLFFLYATALSSTHHSNGCQQTVGDKKICKNLCSKKGGTVCWH